MKWLKSFENVNNTEKYSNLINLLSSIYGNRFLLLFISDKEKPSISHIFECDFYAFPYTENKLSEIVIRAHINYLAEKYTEKISKMDRNTRNFQHNHIMTYMIHDSKLWDLNIDNNELASKILKWNTLEDNLLSGFPLDKIEMNDTRLSIMKKVLNDKPNYLEDIVYDIVYDDKNLNYSSEEIEYYMKLIIQLLKENPSMYNKINNIKDFIKKYASELNKKEIEHIIKSDEYGLFENK